jgi:rhodanese-related sulfurtransferase
MPELISRDDLRAAVESVTLVDALPAAAFAARHLPAAVNVIAEDTDEAVQAALPDRAASIVTYSTDAHCNRGPELAERLQAMGYTDVRVYSDGIADWAAAGLPLENGES